MYFFFVYFVLVGNGSDVGIVTFFLHKELNGATFSASWLFELLPKVNSKIEIKQRN